VSTKSAEPNNQSESFDDYLLSISKSPSKVLKDHFHALAFWLNTVLFDWKKDIYAFDSSFCVMVDTG
jgi:hypothetical protein